MEASYFVSPARTLDNLDFVGFLAITVVLILSSTMDFVSSHDLVFSSATINSPVGLPVGGTFRMSQQWFCVILGFVT